MIERIDIKDVRRICIKYECEVLCLDLIEVIAECAGSIDIAEALVVFLQLRKEKGLIEDRATLDDLLFCFDEISQNIIIEEPDIY